MATYQVKAPDGKTITLQGPAGASQEDIIAQAQALYTPKMAPATPVQPTRAAAAPNRAASVYATYRGALAKRAAALGPEMQQRALDKFDTDPRMQKLRAQAGLAPVTTRKEEIRQVARDTVQESRGRVPDWAIALKGGVTRSLFGIPERIAAAGLKLTGQAGNLSYDEALEAVRARTDEELALSTGGNIAGQVLGALGTGGPVVGAVKGLGAKAAATGLPVVAKAGNLLQRLTTLEKGAMLKNIGKVATAGAAGGGAQILGEGGSAEDIAKGAAIGAVTPIVLGGAVKAAVKGVPALARKISRPFSNDIEKATREVITESPDALAARHAELSSQVGENVPLVAALNDHDYEQVSERVIQRSPQALQIAKTRVAEHVRGMMDRMLAHVNNAGKVADARNTTIGDLAQQRADTADQLMAPIADKKVDLHQLPVAGLERALTRKAGSRIQGLSKKIDSALGEAKPEDIESFGIDPETEDSARGLLAHWGLGEPVTASVKEVDSLRRVLDKAAKGARNAGNEIDALAFENASKSIRGFVAKEYPEYNQMIEAYAAHSRMMEGFKTASAGTRAADIAETRLRNNVRSPEGVVGMKAGEIFRQREAVSASPASAIKAAKDFAAEGSLTRPQSVSPDAARPGTVTENLGGQAAAGLATAAKGETTVLNRLLDTGKLNELMKNEEGALSPHEIAYGAFISGAMPVTKARFLVNFLKPLNEAAKRLSPKAAENLTEMLFSRDPAQTQKAIAALKHLGLSEQIISRSMSNALRDSVVSGSVAAGASSSPDTAPQAVSQQTPTDNGPLPSDLLPETTTEDTAPQAEGDSPYTSQLQQIYDTESPELLDLIDRVERQESGGDQSAVSSAGAVGVMQVMPDTAPEAAQLAGVPWDPQAYRTDANYNRLLGIAYLSDLLHEYDGDVEKALAAYNAGPGRVNEAISSSGGDWLSALPAETQDYVARIS